jgi:hypothetical protein
LQLQIVRIMLSDLVQVVEMLFAGKVSDELLSRARSNLHLIRIVVPGLQRPNVGVGKVALGKIRPAAGIASFGAGA